MLEKEIYGTNQYFTAGCESTKELEVSFNFLPINMDFVSCPFLSMAKEELLLLKEIRFT